MLRNAHVPITPRWYRRELRGHVFGCSCACVCSGLPDCLRAAFVPALIWCQWGLAGSWHPDTSPSIRWHRVVGGIKNDPIRGWQCVLTGTTWWGVFKTAFLLSYRSVALHLFPSSHFARSLPLRSLLLVLLAVGDSGRNVTMFACLDILSLGVSFSCLLSTSQPFASVQIRGDWFWLRTLWLERSVTETLSTELACQCALQWLTSPWIPHSLRLRLFFSAVLHPLRYSWSVCCLQV